jgi:L-lactate dehydrogenase (cytochrome)
VPTYAHYPEEFRTHIGRRSLSDEMTLAADLTWTDVALLRERWKGRLVLKGVLRVDDAERAVAHGVDGIVVSNHGGRNLDSAVSPVDVLPEIVNAVGSRLTVLADSGIRRGADIARYVGLGAEGVMVGRATLFGIAMAGEAGASRVLDLLLQELHMTMGMLGAQTLGDLRRHVIR